MKRLAVLLLAIPLSGCLAEQKRQVAACDQEAKQTSPGETYAQLYAQNSHIINCMKANGFKFNLANARCPLVVVEPFNWRGIYLDPHCYRPTGRFDAVLYEIESKISN